MEPLDAERNGDLPDGELLAALARGETWAIDRLYDRHASYVYGLALRMTNDPQLAEEAVQDTFVSVWRAAAAFDPERASARTWLVTIARRRTLDLVRKRRRHALPSESTDLAADAAPDPAEEVESLLLAQEVRSALEHLSPRLRQAVEMTYYSGYSHREAAERLGVPLGTVKSRLRLAVQQLGRFFAGGDGKT